MFARRWATLYVLFVCKTANLMSFSSPLLSGRHIWMAPKRRKGGGEYRFHGRTLLTSLPSLKMRRNLWYDDCQLIKAWDETVLAIEQHRLQQLGMGWKSDIRNL